MFKEDCKNIDKLKELKGISNWEQIYHNTDIISYIYKYDDFFIDNFFNINCKIENYEKKVKIKAIPWNKYKNLSPKEVEKALDSKDIKEFNVILLKGYKFISQTLDSEIHLNPKYKKDYDELKPIASCLNFNNSSYLFAKEITNKYFIFADSLDINNSLKNTQEILYYQEK